MAILIFTSLLLGFTLGGVIAKFISPVLPIQLFDTTIPGLTQTLQIYKTYDILEFLLSSFFSILVFIFNYLILFRGKKYFSKSTANTVINTYFALSTFIIFIQFNFVTSSGKIVLLLLLILEATYYVFLNKASAINNENLWLYISNGALMGFYFLLFANILSTNFAIPFYLFILAVTLYLLLKDTYTNILSNPSHLILAFSFLFPLNAKFMIFLGLIFVLLTFFTSRKLKSISSTVGWFKNTIYPTIFVTIIVFNPLYYTGNLDSIEEGFWLGWVENLDSGKIIYRDFLAYHPPIMPILLYKFMSITDFTVRNMRLFFHLGVIFSAIVYFNLLTKIFKKSIYTFIVFLIYLAITNTMVRNNVELRLGVGILSIILWFNFLKSQRQVYIYLSGLVSAICFFISSEVGLAIMISLILSTLLTCKNPLPKLAKYSTGIIIGCFPILLYLHVNNALYPFLEQIFFYSSSFTMGYFNLPIERAISTSFLRWHIIWQFFSTNAWFTQLSLMTILAAFMYLIHLAFKSNSFTISFRNLNIESKLIFALSLLGIVLFRSVLGRSDYYHVLLVLMLAIPILFFLLENIIKDNLTKSLATTFIVFVTFSSLINESYLSRQFFKYSTYGSLVEEYNSYNSPRSKILIGTEVNLEQDNGIVEFITQNTSEKDTIFVYPWNPELYFLTNRTNATSVDTPYAFWNEKYQARVIQEIESNQPKFVIIGTGSIFGNMNSDTLSTTNLYIKDNFKEVNQIHSYKILSKK